MPMRCRMLPPWLQHTGQQQEASTCTSAVFFHIQRKVTEKKWISAQCPGSLWLFKWGFKKEKSLWNEKNRNIIEHKCCHCLFFLNIPGGQLEGWSVLPISNNIQPVYLLISDSDCSMQIQRTLQVILNNWAIIILLLLKTLAVRLRCLL